MGIRDLGYRHWDGQYTSHGTRWWSIAKQGIRATVFNKLRLTALLLLMFVVWAPYVGNGVASFLAGPGAASFECAQPSFEDNSRLFKSPDEAFRCNLYDMLRGWEFLIAPLFIAMVAAPLVSSDLRSNAMYIYLSRPLRRSDYIIGKMVAVAIWAFPVTVLPNLMLWVMVISSQSKRSQVQEPWTILGEILLIQVIVMALLVLLALAISSFTKQWQTSFLAFLGGYIGLWIIANMIVHATKIKEWYYISIVDNIVNLAQSLYGVPSTNPDWPLSLLIILGVIGTAFVLFLWRILKLEVAE